VNPRVTYALVVLLVAYVVALAVVSGFGNTAVAVTGWLILTGVFAVVACIQLLRRRS
jgi:pheromone shutdown protein TraB